ncbi:MAG TPA: alpha/beta hydrolase [Actinocrinis sp.]
MTTEITAHTMLPRAVQEIELATEDGLKLVGELALPADRPPAATLLTLHPLPTAAGMMDSHVLRKASWRLPALADIAVLRFNTRGTESPRGRSEGAFDEGIGERHDVAAALDFVRDRGLSQAAGSTLWLLGWSFGTELALQYGRADSVTGAILLSPPLRRAGDADLDAWAEFGRPLTVLVPEFDDYLRPDEARKRFARVPQAEVIGVDGAKHLWVGEKYVRIVLDEIVRRVNPSAAPLPVLWDGPWEKYSASIG